MVLGNLRSTSLPFFAAAAVVGTILFFLLLWFVSRRGSRIAAWLTIIWVAASSAVFGVQFALGWIGTGPLTAASSIVVMLMLAALVFLVQPPSWEWLARGKNVDPEIFR